VRRLLFLGLVACLNIGAAFPREQSPSVFGRRESVEQVDISPDGKFLLYLEPGPGPETILSVVSLDTLKPHAVTKSTGSAESLHWCNFVSAERIVCQVYGIPKVGGDLYGMTRLISMKVDGSDVKELGQRGSILSAGFRQFDGSVLDWRPATGDNKILMERVYVPDRDTTSTRLAQTKEGLAVDLVDTVSLKVTPIEHPREGAADYLTDGRGNVRVMATGQIGSFTGNQSGMLVYYYRTVGSPEWRKLGSYNMENEDGVRPLAVDAELNSAYVLQKLNGRRALYRIKLDGSMATELVYANDKVDVGNVVRVGKGLRVIGVSFAAEQGEVIYFDSEYQKLATSLGKVIANLPLVQFEGASADGSKLLIYASSDTDAGRYYLYDRSVHSLHELMLVRPQLEGVPLAHMRPVSYPAGDGVLVPAYLTLPPGKESAKGLPAVIMPHGGPESRDVWGFDWLAQFLAYQGYAVLQPNYRGSAGYGDAWLAENGFRGWRTSIGDITAGAKWLVSQGIADRNRLAIVGWSYGGYAALQAAETEPDLFKAAVAIAPVTDLEMLKSEAAGFTSAAIVSRFVGSGPHVREGSPLQNVDRMAAPVLLFHGDRDLNVDVNESRRMQERLRSAGKKSDYVEFKGLDHQLRDSNARSEMLAKIRVFLAANLGG
jgi:dipeptidyl aminopeptidase/acylaminoacyl peptidase